MIRCRARHRVRPQARPGLARVRLRARVPVVARMLGTVVGADGLQAGDLLFYLLAAVAMAMSAIVCVSEIGASREAAEGGVGGSREQRVQRAKDDFADRVVSAYGGTVPGDWEIGDSRDSLSRNRRGEL